MHTTILTSLTIRDNGEFRAWNRGWTYRNGGVDIEDQIMIYSPFNNGKHIGFTFTMENGFPIPVKVNQTGAYKAVVRVASQETGGQFHLSLNGEDITTTQTINGQLEGGLLFKIIPILMILSLMKVSII